MSRANPEKRRVYQRAWYLANREKILAMTAARDAANWEKKCAYRLANAEKRRADARAWHQANPERRYALNRNRRARLRGAPGMGVTTADWQRILKASKGRCFYCKKRRALTMDHVIALAKGGAHAPENVVAACFPCNAGKGDRLWMLV